MSGWEEARMNMEATPYLLQMMLEAIRRGEDTILLNLKISELKNAVNDFKNIDMEVAYQTIEDKRLRKEIIESMEAYQRVAG